MEEILDSLVKLDLLVYFHRNPDAADTVEGLAIWVGSTIEEVKRAAEELLQVGILEKEEELFHYTKEPGVIKAIEGFINQRYMVREERMKLIIEILQKGDTSGE